MSRMQLGSKVKQRSNASKVMSKVSQKIQVKRGPKLTVTKSSPRSADEGLRQLTAFGERLVGALQSKGMNDSDLAKKLGIAQPNIHTLKYKTDRPRHSTVVGIAKALGVAPEALMPTAGILGVAPAADGAKVYLVIEGARGRQTIRLA